VLVYTLTERGVWVYDLSRGTLTPLTLGSEAYGPAWFPDGRRVAFGWLKDGRRSLAVQSADGTAPPQVLVPGLFHPSSFTPDGRWLAYSSNVSGRFEVYVRPYPGPGATETVSLEGGGVQPGIGTGANCSS